ncbi:MAG: hypothetical protein WBN92_08245, partial [Terriglobia bacterium]
MIIENAFLKLPVLLVNRLNRASAFESTVVHLMSVAVLMELNARNIARPFEHVLTENPYPSRGKKGRSMRADLFVNLEGAVPMDRG